MRLFVALDVSGEMRDAAARVMERAARTLASAGPGVRVAWVPADRLHLTLRFIGEVPDTLAATIHERLAPPFACAPFELTLAGIGVFPGRGAPRVIWAGVTGGAEPAGRLQQEASRRLEGLPVARDDRPFSPHLTLGRIRETAARARTLIQEMPRTCIGRCTIDHVTLYESRLSSSGPTYTARLRVPLSA